MSLHDPKGLKLQSNPPRNRSASYSALLPLALLTLLRLGESLLVPFAHRIEVMASLPQGL